MACADCLMQLVTCRSPHEGAWLMDQGNGAAHDEALAQARRVVASQASEIERLRARLASEKYAEELQEALTLAAATGTIASPVTHSRLLEMIVEAAAHVISAQA